MTQQSRNDWYRDNIDSAAMRATEDGCLGFNAFDRGGGFFTALSRDASEQVYLSRADLEWLRDEGIPAWLGEMEQS
jgi:hypothetical protein